MEHNNQWESDSIEIGKISLDKKNPRLPIKDMDNKAVIKWLIDNEDVEDLAKSICKIGLFPTESIVLIKENDQFVVVEGNRRVCAASLLLNPTLAPNKKIEKKFSDLSDLLSDAGKENLFFMASVITPTRRDANFLLINKHISKTVKRWSTVNQTRYIENLLDQGYSIDEIRDLSGKNRSDVVKAARMISLLNQSLEASLDEKTKQKIKQPNFDLTNIDRVFSPKATQERLGYSFTSDGTLEIHNTKEFKKLFPKILKRVVNHKSPSREYRTVQDIKDKLLNEYGSKKHADDNPKVDAKSRKDEPPTLFEVPSTTPRVHRPSPKKGLISSHSELTLKNDKMRQMFCELKGIDLDKNYYAPVILFRSFLQMILTSFIEEAGALKKLQKIARSSEPTLAELVDFLHEGAFKNLVPRENLRKILALSRKQKNEFYSIEYLNSVAHNDCLQITSKVGRDIWTHYEKLINFLISKEQRVSAIKDFNDQKDAA